LDTYRTLSTLVALEVLGADVVAVAPFAAIHGETKLVGLADVAPETSHARTALALARPHVARAVQGADRVAVASLTTLLKIHTKFKYV
jgi:hypothetical protein